MIVKIARNKPDVEEGGVGIIGYKPSETARSPKVWNYVFKELGWNKKYYAFDLDEENLEEFANYARENLVGFNITVPYKEKIIKHLDSLNDKAEFIGAVNFVKNEEGKLKGYNTDGEGAVKAMYYGDEPFIDTLKSKSIALIGAGGVAKAIAAYLIEEKPLRINIYNRTRSKGAELSDKINHAGITSEYFERLNFNECFNRLDERLNHDLVINATSIGQAGWVNFLESRNEHYTNYVTLEHLSPLGQLNIHGLVNKQDIADFFELNLREISENTYESLAFLLNSETTHFFDVVHTPSETVMLQHARWFGRKTMNGKLMNVMQAVECFVKLYPKVDYDEILEIMKKA